MGIISGLKLAIFKKEWRKKNQENQTYPRNIFDINLVTVGKMTYGEIYVSNFRDDVHLNIGNFCSIAPEVVFLLGADHNIRTVSTYPYKVKMLNEKFEGLSKGDIIVEDDVWIGFGAKILSGVHIGRGAVIAAGSVVTKDVSPYAVVGGAPARVLKYRFSKKIIQEMMNIDYSKVTETIIRNNMEFFYKEVKASDVFSIPEELKRKH